MSQKTNPTLTVHIKLLGFLTQRTDRPEMTLEVGAGTTVAQVIGRLGQQFGPRFQQAILDKHGNLHGGIEVILNRQQISARRISQVEIEADSKLVLIPLVGGGYG
jgi:molybdopterin converting factor small subunit